jgi:dimethylglycine dehydrogenase
VHGAISHPPDGNPLIGPVAWREELLVLLRHPDRHRLGARPDPRTGALDGAWRGDISMREFDPRRFGPYATKDWQVIKAKEDYCLRHEIPFPHFNRLAGRPVKPSPLYERLKAKGAVFEEVYGHERPRWFARMASNSAIHYGFRRTPVHEMVAFAEARPCASAPGSWTSPPSPRWRCPAPDAEALLDRLVANKLPQKPGGIALTHMLNRRGRIELETTVVRMAPKTVSIWSARRFSSSA